MCVASHVHALAAHSISTAQQRVCAHEAQKIVSLFTVITSFLLVHALHVFNACARTACASTQSASSCRVPGRVLTSESGRSGSSSCALAVNAVESKCCSSAYTKYCLAFTMHRIKGATLATTAHKQNSHEPKHAVHCFCAGSDIHTLAQHNIFLVCF